MRSSRAVTSLLVSVPDKTDLVVAASACNMETCLSPTRSQTSTPQQKHAGRYQVGPNAAGGNSDHNADRRNQPVKFKFITHMHTQASSFCFG